MRPLPRAVFLMSFLSFLSSCLAHRKEPPVNTPFGKAYAAFRDEVASLYGQKPGSLTIVPAEEAATVSRLTTGPLLSFMARWPIVPPRSEGPKEWWVGGFADGEGHVVLEKKSNLGELLRAAHFLDAGKSPGARELAERVLSMGLEAMGVGRSPAGPTPPSHVLREQGAYVMPVVGVGSKMEEGDITPPSIERAPDGTATLTFFYAYDASPGVAQVARLRLTCNAAYQARLDVSQVMLRGGGGPF